MRRRRSSPAWDHARTARARAWLMWRACWTAIIVLSVMTLCAAAVALTRVVTLGRGRRFGMNVLATRAARALLWLGGVRVQLEPAPSPGQPRWPTTPHVYIANHSSTLDFFIITSLGIPNLRAFLGRRTRVIPQIRALGWGLGHFFIPTQDDPQGRVACFERAEQILEATQDNVFLTPEGTRNPEGLGPFNRGAFHMAAVLGWPIVPLVIDIPAAINPGKRFGSLPGQLRVKRLEAIPTRGWRLEELDERRAQVRALMLQALDQRGP